MELVLPSPLDILGLHHHAQDGCMVDISSNWNGTSDNSKVTKLAKSINLLSNRPH